MLGSLGDGLNGGETEVDGRLIGMQAHFPGTGTNPGLQRIAHSFGGTHVQVPFTT